MNGFFITILLFAAGAFESVTSDSRQSDIIQGPRTRHSVRIHSSLMSRSSFSWSGENFISRIEIWRQNRNGPQIYIIDGLHRNRLQLWTDDDASIDAWVNILSEPRNLTLGTPARDARRVHT